MTDRCYDYVVDPSPWSISSILSTCFTLVKVTFLFCYFLTYSHAAIDRSTRDSTGAQGYLQRPSQQELETVFGTHKDSDIVEIVLSKGKIQSSDAPLKIQGSKNSSQCVFTISISMTWLKPDTDKIGMTFDLQIRLVPDVERCCWWWKMSMPKYERICCSHGEKKEEINFDRPGEL